MQEIKSLVRVSWSVCSECMLRRTRSNKHVAVIGTEITSTAVQSLPRLRPKVYNAPTKGQPLWQ